MAATRKIFTKFTSKSSRRRQLKLKQRSQIEQPEPEPNWLQLPSDVTTTIFQRVGAKDMLENVQKVCSEWRRICKDPYTWRVIDMLDLWDVHPHYLQKMCMHAVDRSQGQLVDISIEFFGTIDLLHYIADRSSQLRRLHLSCLYNSVYEGLSEVLQKFPLLEELTLCLTYIPIKVIETAGRFCPLLKSLKIKQKGNRDQHMKMVYNQEDVAIGKNLPELCHLQLIGSNMSNIGLQAILDGCPHLESLDLRRCLNISLSLDLAKRCLKQIKCVRLPDDSMEDYKFDAQIYDSYRFHHYALHYSYFDRFRRKNGYIYCDGYRYIDDDVYL